MKTITISALFTFLAMNTFAQNICPSSFKRNNGNGTCGALGELRLNFPSGCPANTAFIDSVFIDGIKSNVTFASPETSHCGGNNGYISYCVKSGNMPPANVWFIYFHVQGGNTYTCTVVNSASTTLAVKYSAFDATVSGNTVTCNWITAQEINNDYFQLERSFDGINYNTAAIIFPTGSNTSTTQSYHYKDNSSLIQNKAILYYRIKQVDKDGAFSYSKVITVRLKAGAVTTLQLSPNPFNNNLSIKIDATENALATTKIINTTGQTVATTQSSVNKGINVLQIGNLNGLSKGIYVVQVLINGVVTDNKKVIKN